MTEQLLPMGSNLNNDTRQLWVEPTISLLGTDDSELGANPVVPEGAFAMGS